MKVLNKHHIGELNNDQIYAGRGFILGNPFPKSFFNSDRDLVIELHKEYFLSQLANSTEVAKTAWSIPLNNDLVCFCSPKACHLDIIVEFKQETKNMTYKEARKYFLNKYNYTFLPLLEGKTHINIYSKSLTELGRLASNFAHTPFEHPDYGYFESMEGFWFYVGTGFRHEILRKLHGNKAKQAGSTYKKVLRDDFESIIVSGLRAKVEQTPRLKELLTLNHLPFKHYYFWANETNDDFKTIKEGNGLLEKTFTQISSELGESYKVIIAGSRSIKDSRWIMDLITSSGFRIKEVISGEAKGIDSFAKYYASINHLPYKGFEVSKEEWEKNKGAGFIRNKKMGEYADKAIIGIQNNSSGSLHMKKFMESLNKEVYVKEYRN